MSNPFKVGDIVCTDKSYVTEWPKALTAGKPYTITAISGVWIRFISDVGREGGFSYTRFKIAAASRITVSPTGSFTAVYTAPPTPDYTTAVLADDNLTYEERQAAKPVTSQGKFSKGQVVVYSDGTEIPNAEARTVLRCTATCVWFEETYSMPFNPDEFTRAY